MDFTGKITLVLVCQAATPGTSTVKKLPLLQMWQLSSRLFWDFLCLSLLLHFHVFATRGCKFALLSNELSLFRAYTSDVN